MLLKLNNFKVLNINFLSISEMLLFIYISSLILIAKLPVGNIISKLLGIIFISHYIIFQVIWNNKKIYINREIKLILIWIIFCFISGFVANDHDLFIDKMLTILQLTAFFIIGYSLLFKNKIKIEYIFITLLVSVIIILILGIFQQEKSSFITSNRISSTTGNPNTLAIYGSFAFIFSIYLFSISKKKIIRLILICSQFIILLGVLKTESRKGIILIPISLLLYFLLINFSKIIRSKKKIKSVTILILKLIILISLLLIAFQYFKNSEYFHRFEKMSNYLKMRGKSFRTNIIKVSDYSSYERQKFIKYGLEMWLDNPLFGTGLDNFRINIQKYWSVSERKYSHNNYIELLSTVGIFWFMAYYSIYLSLFLKIALIKKTKKGKNDKVNRIANLFIVILTSFMILEIAMVSYYSKFFWLMLLIISAYTDRILKDNNYNIV